MHRDVYALLEEVEIGTVRCIYLLEDSSDLADVLSFEKARKGEANARQSVG